MHLPRDPGDVVVVVIGAVAVLCLLGALIIAAVVGFSSVPLEDWTLARDITGAVGGVTLLMWAFAYGGNAKSKGSGRS